MPYTRNLPDAARRHFRAGDILFAAAGAGEQPGAKAVAGYLFGLAAEMAVKAMMGQSGLLELDPAQRREDPYYAHFPSIKTLLSRGAKGRRGRELRAIAENPRFLQHWDTRIRYAPSTEIVPSWIDAWRADAENAIQQMSEVR